MATSARGKRTPWFLAAACVAAVAGWLTLHTSPAPAAVPAAAPPQAAAAPAPSPAPAFVPPAAAAAPAPSPALAALTAEPDLEVGAQVDLQRLRAQLPDNRFWKDAAPTDDPEVLRSREEEGQRWNTLFGKVQANEASVDEVHQYYAYRRQLSEDYIALSTQILENGGEQLSERDVSLHQLNIQLHQARLAELPRQEREALERREVQEARRQAWLRQGGPH